MASAVPARMAPLGKVWMCQACGKRTRDLFGEERGWDESCALNAVLVDVAPASTDGPTTGGVV